MSPTLQMPWGSGLEPYMLQMVVERLGWAISYIYTYIYLNLPTSEHMCEFAVSYMFLEFRAETCTTITFF